jgi:hypothetical protein
MLQLRGWSPQQRNDVLTYAASTPVLVSLYEAVQAELKDEPEQLSVEAVGARLEDDEQELLLEIAASPDLLNIVQEADLDEEWRETRQELQRLSVKQDIEAVAEELERLDAKVDKSAEDEARQEELLEKIVRLRQRQGL